MDSWDKALLGLWITIGVVVVVIILGCMTIAHFDQKMYIEHGYTRTSLPGQSCVNWTKE